MDVEADLAVDSGQAPLDLGDTRRAHQLIREGQKLLPPSRDKTRGVFRAYEARSHLDLGEPERAAAAAREALQVAQRIGAPRRYYRPTFREMDAQRRRTQRAFGRCFL